MAKWGQHIIYLKHNKQKIVLCHYPLEEWDGWWRGSLHLHCHTHSHEFNSAKNRGNVGVDYCNFFPIELNQAIERVKNNQ